MDWMDTLEPRTLLSAVSAHINFEPKGAPKFPGYTADIGWAYRSRGKLRFGWSHDNTRFATDRNSPVSPDQRYDTFNTLRAGKKNLTWSVTLPNGTYSVHIVSGDAKGKPALYKIKANSSLVVSGKTTTAKRFVEGTATVKVTRGKLTISAAKGSTGFKINYIDIGRTTPESATFQAEKADASSGVQVSGNSITSADPGDWIEFQNVQFNGKSKSVQVRMAAGDSQNGQEIQFHLDSPTGPLLGTLLTEGAGPGTDFRTQSAPISDVKGVHDLYATFVGSTSVGSVDAIRFSTRPLVTIMPLGDSITEGKGPNDGTPIRDSYRRDLWQMLEDAGYSVDFVGTRTGLRPNSGNPDSFDWDLDHEAVSGDRADMIEAQLPGWLNELGEAPDIVLIHLGTNDIMAGQSVSSTIGDLGGIIDDLRSANPHVTILLAQLLPTDYPQIDNSQINALNAAMPDLVSAKQQSGSKIVLVNQNSGFDADTQTTDGIHPTPAGEEIVAQKWFNALKPFLA